MKTLSTVVATSAALMISGTGLLVLAACRGPDSTGGSMNAAAADPFVLKHRARLIDGTEVDLSQYKGKVVMIVNVASKCGFTGQYEDLQKLYAANRDRGLVILGFPSNDFMGQEPGSNEEIAEFCRTNFGVEFPMFEKIHVKGDGAHPLYKQLAAQPEPIGGPPKWNFTKFLVDREGRVVFRSDARLLSRRSLEPELVEKVQALLGAG